MSPDPPVRFVVLTAPRSGSTWLMDQLGRSTGARVYTELFIPRRRPRTDRLMTPETAEYLDRQLRGLPLFCEYPHRLIEPRPVRAVRYLEEISRQPDPAGFKLMYGNLIHVPEIAAYLAWRGWRIVHLVRENHLDVVISSRLRHLTQTVHALNSDPRQETGPIYLEPRRLLQDLRRARRNVTLARVFLGLMPNPRREVHYESLVQGDRSFQEVCEFLGLPTAGSTPTSHLRKLVTRGHSQILANYTEIREVLRGTGFEDLLH